LFIVLKVIPSIIVMRCLGKLLKRRRQRRLEELVVVQVIPPRKTIVKVRPPS
jgi:hypothetical protein